MGWYDLSLASGGQVFAPGLQGRGDLIRKAAYTINGRAAELAPSVQQAALPVFTPDAEVPDAEVFAIEPEVLPKLIAPTDPENTPPLPQITAQATQPAAEPTPPPSAAMATGAQVALMAARLPFLVFSGN